MPVLLDTTVASLLHPKKKGNESRERYEPHMRGQLLVLSFQTVAELLQWADQNNWGKRERDRLDGFISRFVIVHSSNDLARAWANVMTQARSHGRRIEAGDAWIAATAIHGRIPLLTHDRDFAGLGIADLNVVCYA